MLSAAPQLTLIRHACKASILGLPLLSDPPLDVCCRKRRKDPMGLLLILEQSFNIWKVPLGFSFLGHSRLNKDHF